MPEPLYSRLDVRAVRDGGRLEVLGASVGPAGVAAVELPDGSVWEVDHAQPDLLVSLDVDDAEDPTSSALLVAAFGGDGALFVSERIVSSDEVVDEDVDRRWGTGRGRTGPGGRTAAQAGRSVLLADLAVDEDIDPLARIAAVLELAAAVDGGGPGADLFAPLIGAGLDAADDLAGHVDDVTLDWLDPKVRSRLGALVRRVLRDGGPVRSGLDDLAHRLQYGPAAAVDLLAAGLDEAVEPLDEIADGLSMRLSPVAALSELPVPEGVEVIRTSPGRAVVTVVRSDQQRWVKVARVDGLVLLAQSRLHREGLVDRAEIVVPDDVDTSDLVVSVLGTDELCGPAGPLEAVRAAVRAGRRAARASRLGDRAGQAELWEHCAELWEVAGDVDRADRARDLAGGMTSVRMLRAMITDEVASRAASFL